MKNILLLLGMIFITSCSTVEKQIPINQTENPPVEIIQESDNNQELLKSGIYTKPNNTFSLNIPTEHYLDESETYTRVQNYISRDTGELRDGEYYFEILSGDAISEGSCEEMVFNGQEQNFGNALGLIGDGQQGGDAGGFRKAVCVDQDGVKYYFQAVGNGSGQETVQEIFQSIKFN